MVWASCPCFALCLSVFRSITLRIIRPLSSKLVLLPRALWGHRGQVFQWPNRDTRQRQAQDSSSAQGNNTAHIINHSVSFFGFVRKNTVAAARSFATVVLHFIAGQDWYPSAATVPWPKAIQVCDIVNPFFPDLYLYPRACSLLQAQSYVTWALACNCQCFQVSNFGTFALHCVACTRTFAIVWKYDFTLPLVLISKKKTMLDPTMPVGTCGNQTLRATARDSTYYLLQDLRDPVNEFPDFGGGLIPTDQGYFSGCAAGSQIGSVRSNPNGGNSVMIRHLLFFVPL